MPLGEKKDFWFISSAYSSDLEEPTFHVWEFTGVEGISRLYEFNITLASEDPAIDLKAVLNNPAKLIIRREEKPDCVISGIVATFEQLGTLHDYYHYRAVLAPRLWLSDQYRENQLFLDKSVPDIIEEILSQAGVTDYMLKLSKDYSKWEYICQYGETDFDFMSRWMEREGIYYFFEQGDGGEKLIITDTLGTHIDIPDEQTTIKYVPETGQIAQDTEERVSSLVCRKRRLPEKVVLKDYNYREPKLDLRVEETVDPEGRGEKYIYGEHYKSVGEGKGLAKIRAEEMLCRETMYEGQCTAPTLCSGFTFTIDEHYRPEYNQRYILTEVIHHGRQARFFQTAAPATPMGMPNWTGLDINPSAMLREPSQVQTEKESGMGYRNRFTVIPAEVQFRPERLTIKPRFFGTMHAHVDAESSGEYAEIDDQGRYKVILPFDQSGRGGGKASRFIRMAQPYAGMDYGMHFPLHKEIEVLLTFIDGDMDRPIISGSVPNPDTISPVTDKNQKKSIIRTGGGNEMHFFDQGGQQEMFFHGPHNWKIHMENDKTQNIDSNEFSTIGINRIKKVGENEVAKIGKHKITKIAGNRVDNTDLNRVEIVKKNKGEIVKGNKKQNVKLTKAINANNRMTNINETDSTTAKLINLNASDQIQIIVGRSSIILNKESIKLSHGENSGIIIDANGIGVSGPSLLSSARDINSINGSQVHINCSEEELQMSSGESGEAAGEDLSITSRVAIGSIIGSMLLPGAGTVIGGIIGGMMG